jgi:hypothetical protein
MKTLALVNVFSRGALAHAAAVGIGSGTWVYGASVALGRRVLASNRQSTCLPGLPGLRQLCQRRGRDSGHHLPGTPENTTRWPGQSRAQTWSKPPMRPGRVGSIGLTAGRPSPDDRGAGCDIVSFVTQKHRHDLIRPTLRRETSSTSLAKWHGRCTPWLGRFGLGQFWVDGRSVDRDAKQHYTAGSQHRLQHNNEQPCSRWKTRDFTINKITKRLCDIHNKSF